MVDLAEAVNKLKQTSYRIKQEVINNVLRGTIPKTTEP
ncbi:MAG: hypothetical protein IT210_09290 [Armatimonadetes bacterium]|nr:hypothetical protein [Armatimonadota bacterium]